MQCIEFYEVNISKYANCPRTKSIYEYPRDLKKVLKKFCRHDFKRNLQASGIFENGTFPHFYFHERKREQICTEKK